MKLSLLSTLSEFSEGQAKGRHVVVIDVLRASSTIVHACENGIGRIIPVASVEDATKLLPTLDRKDTLTGGESEGKKIEGFDLGNSPTEYAARVVKGKTLVFSTTNGTAAMTRSAAAEEIVVACFRNLSAVVARLAASHIQDVAVLCAGNQGHMALEDFICGGLIVERLAAGGRGAMELDDGARAARVLAATMSDVREVVGSSTHGRRLAELGFSDDLDFCADVDTSTVVPRVGEGRISGPEALSE